MTKLEKAGDRLNEQFREKLRAAFLIKYSASVKTEANIFTMGIVTRMEDGSDFTEDQMNFLKAYEQGYSDAMQIVLCMANERFSKSEPA